jgi:hypothetical protein
MSGEPSLFNQWSVLDPELERHQIDAAFASLTGRLLGKQLRANLNTIGDQAIPCAPSAGGEARGLAKG